MEQQTKKTDNWKKKCIFILKAITFQNKATLTKNVVRKNQSKFITWVWFFGENIFLLILVFVWSGLGFLEERGIFYGSW